MLKPGLYPDVVTFATLIDVLRKMGDLKVLEDMRMWMMAVVSEVDVENNNEEGCVRAMLIMGMPFRRTRFNIARMNRWC